jgi:hypothetical protein
MSKCVWSRNLKNGAAHARVRLLCHINKLMDQPVISQSRNSLHFLELIRCFCYMLPAERFLYDGLDFLLSGFSVLSCIPCCTLCFNFILLVHLFRNMKHKLKKLKCTLVQTLRLCTGHTTHRGSRGIALPFHDHGTRRGWGVSVTPQPLFTPQKDPVPIVQEAGWAPWPVWTGAENLAPTGILSPDHPAHSQSLYWLRYSAHMKHNITLYVFPTVSQDLSALLQSSQNQTAFVCLSSWLTTCYYWLYLEKRKLTCTLTLWYLHTVLQRLSYQFEFQYILM